MNDVHFIDFSSNNTVDRKAETEILLSCINNQEADAIIIYSKTGIGKSTLSNRIMKKSNGFIPIVIKTSPENKTETVTEGFFLSKIFNQMVHFFQEYSKEYKDCSFQYYLRSNKNEFVKKNSIEKYTNEIDNTVSLKTIGISLSKYILSKIFLLNEYNVYPKLLLDTKDSMLIANDYIKYLLKKLHILVNIDNLQNIDSYSLQLLTDWIATCNRNSIFLFEYTLSESCKINQLVQISVEWTSYDLEIKLLELKALNCDYALEALQKMHISTEESYEENHFFEDAKQYYLHHSNGNIQKLIDFSLQYSQNSPLKDCFDPTFERFKLLNSFEKLTLSIIILHGGEIVKNTLLYLMRNSPIPSATSIEKVLKKMEEELYLKQESNIISIVHSSIKDSWDNNSIALKKYDLIAFGVCEKYYNKVLLTPCLSPQENIDQATLFLLKIYSKYDPQKLEKLISTIGKLVSEQITPTHVWEYYLIFLNYIKGREKEHLSSLYGMVIFCFNHGLYQYCLYVIQILEQYLSDKNMDFLFAYKINCYAYLEADDAISYCEKYLLHYKTDSQRYMVYLLLMVCYRSINKMDKVMCYVQKIQQIQNYSSMKEYGIFLRFSEIYMQRHEALPYVKQSIDYYQSINDSLMEARSRLTYFFLLAVTNDFSKASEELDACKSLVASTHYWEGILLLNEASLQLIQKKYGHATARMLKKAELSIYSTFDRLLTLTMELINEYESNHARINSCLIKQITQLLANESDKHLICLVAYDLYLYFSKINEKDTAKRYYSIAEETCDYNLAVSMKMKGKRNPYTPNVFNTEWSIGFTFFWSVDVPKPDI